MKAARDGVQRPPLMIWHEGRSPYPFDRSRDDSAMTYQLTSITIAVLLAGVILWLVRRSHLHGPYAVWWVAVAIAVLGLGAWPGVFDVIASRLGIGYSPILAVLLSFAMLLIKILTMDLERSRQERRIRRLAQRLAMLEARLKTISYNHDGSTDE